MKFAASNIALPAFGHTRELALLADIGLHGLEVAPSRIWKDTWAGLAASDVAQYRKQIEAAGLKAVGLHSLFFDHPELGLFRGPDTRASTLDFMAHLSAVCRDLGGRTLIYGGGRQRGEMALEDAYAEAEEFFGELLARIAGHGTCYSFEPLGPKDSDFINSVADSIRLVRALDSPMLRVQLDAKALVENHELNAETVATTAPYLVHVHANEPGLAVLGSSGAIDHAALGKYLKGIGYDGYVSIEQRMLSEENPMADLAESVRVLKKCYL